MSSPVTEAEAQSLVQQLRDMAERAEQHGQDQLYMVLTINAESLADNLEHSGAFDDAEC